MGSSLDIERDKDLKIFQEEDENSKTFHETLKKHPLCELLSYASQEYMHDILQETIKFCRTRHGESINKYVDYLQQENVDLSGSNTYNWTQSPVYDIPENIQKLEQERKMKTIAVQGTRKNSHHEIFTGQSSCGTIAEKVRITKNDVLSYIISRKAPNFIRNRGQLLLAKVAVESKNEKKEKIDSFVNDFRGESFFFCFV